MERNRSEHKKDEFAELIFSWSLDDLLNKDLYKYQAEDIPLNFQSEEHYLGSFVYPLLEETRAELASSMEIMYRAPFAEILSISESKRIKGAEKMIYDVTVGPWSNRFGERGKEPYRTLPGDLLILSDGKPESVSDLQRLGKTWAFSLVNKITDDDIEDYNTTIEFKVKASQQIEFQDGMFVVFLMNVTTQKRIWNSLGMHRNTSIIKEVLYSDFNVKENCNICSFGQDDLIFRNVDPRLLDILNESQRLAIMEALCKTECSHKSSVEQIWGPPGTGKTTTVSVLLFILLRMNRRTLTCAPTNIAMVQVASRVLRLVKESFNTTMAGGDSLCSVGDVLLFGNKERLKVGSEIEEIYLEHRVKRLTECLGSQTGWNHCIRSMIDLLQNCVSQYDVYVENELFTEAQLANESQMGTKTEKLKVKSFIEFLQDRFSSCSLPLRRCIITFCTHIPRSFMGESNFQNMISLLNKLNSFKLILSQENIVSEDMQCLFTSEPLQDDSFKLGDTPSINSVRIMSLSVLRTLLTSFEGLGLPNVLKRDAIMDFCFERASLIFCTTSSSYKLHSVAMSPLNILVIDEAAQLKEAESTIPLQLPGVKHAILIGDEHQLPAMVTSNVCIASKFGRSLFDRLSSLGHSKHLLNVQYRMHPTISFFPNRKFYKNQILDAENVTCKSYEKRYLSGPMFGSYSFINVVGGREEKDEDGRSWRNMVEVAIVIKIVQNLHKAWSDSKRKLTVGVVSPYAAQVVSIQDKLARKYEKLDGFSVNVKSIDGFQGGEEDIIILSTVRSNSHGNVGFLFSLERTNVALTRARHCLWILGNEKTLVNSESKIWKDLVCDARKRCCLFDADVDDNLKMTIISTKKELEQLDDLVNGNSVLFKNAKWKVLFSDDFRRSFGKLTSAQLKKMVLNLLLKLSSGWRPKNKSMDLFCDSSSHILKQFKVEGLYVICTTDIIKECKYIQVFKVWDILKFEEIPKLTKRLESIFAAYTEDYINRCAAKCLEGNLEVPRSWPASQELIRFRYLSNNEGGCEVNVHLGDGRNYVESSKVSESLLLMKFYSLSSGVVNQLLSGKDVDLPMQVTDEQMDIILFCKSSFIIGRSGTGKTTILTMKLFQKEQLFRVASEGFYEESKVTVSMEDTIDDPEETKPPILRQLFVTVSPKLCYAVKQHVSHLVSISSNGNSSAEINLDEADVVASDFNDIPDTFVDIPMKNYPLVITFHKFLMMLDGTLGNSYFERFLEAREGLRGNHISSRSVALQTFIRSREVTFDRFCSFYWPHFNSNLTKRHDPSRVFTEIISHIKGGLQAGECVDGKLSYERYSLLAETRSSTLNKEKRETIYTIFQAYEKMKTEHGDFDLGDLVNDIHRRLENAHYEGDKMDFVYIDEVQDLSMRQISLFKHICQNVDEGFVFAGDTAQTIARGIDFRFQDIRSVFYKEFLIPKTEKQVKGRVSEIFQLKQNFRTHAGVLELAQSVIDILYCYFIHSIDILEPEVSLISGEAPVLLESGNDENAIVTIFGGSGSGGEIVGFGAEQVILVRDDRAKTEIFDYVGKNALVLTILECKGLEFQDVLLYNFFGTSPLKDQWRVIYGYMKERDWLIEKCPQSFPSFNESRHSVLCSELKQLYVAITRTRQRLWICENKEELSKPMFDYWKTRGLVQIRKLDDSVAQAMRVASCPQEWRERGKKLFYENNFVMATMCFERAGDTFWENLAKASGLRASANQIRGTNPEAFVAYLREAIGMFESIGKLESAASCYYDLGEYEIAGKIYLYKCGKTDAAAECFTLAGCYGDAAEAYVNRCKGKLQVDWKVLRYISEAIKGNKGVALKSLSAASTIKKELDKLIGTLATALEDQQFCAGKDATVIREANRINDDLKLLASAFDSSQQVVLKSVQGLVERLQSSRPKMDDFLNHAVTSQELKVEQVVVSESSNTTEVDETGEEKNHVEGTGDDGSPVEAEPENKSSTGNTQDAKSKMERDDGVMLAAAYRREMVASFLEIAVGQTQCAARQYLQAANWNLEQAIHLYYLGEEFENSSTLPSDNSDEKSKGSGFWGADQGSTSRAETSKDNLASLYRPPFALMYHGSFEEAKEAANGKDRWLIVNVQSTREFSSYMLNRDTWANEVVFQTITNNFVFWQVDDDTEEGSKTSALYKLDSYPATLVIDPITGQKMRLWRGMVQPDCLLEDLLQYMDASPKDHHFSLSHSHSKENPCTSPSKDETNEDDEEMKLALALSMGTINDNVEVSLKGSDAVKEFPKKEMCTYPPLPPSQELKVEQGLVERLQSCRPKIDEFLNHVVTSQELKVEQVVVSESSNTTEVNETGEEKNHVEGAGDDGSPVDAAPENKSSIGNTQDAKSKKCKTKNKQQGKKKKNGKGKKK